MIVKSATDILENCVLELEKLSGKSEYPPISSYPNLPPVTEEVSEMQAWMSMNKGVTLMDSVIIGSETQTKRYSRIGGIMRPFHNIISLKQQLF